MRRGAKLEGVDDEAKFILGLLRAYSKNLEHALLHIGIVDTDAAAAKFIAVEHKVICVGADALQILLGVAVEPLFMLRLGGGEGVVHGVETPCFVVPFKQREVHNPKRSELLGIAETKAAAHLQA